ncbi:TPA: phage polarity suppression protein [Raoultella planticola]
MNRTPLEQAFEVCQKSKTAWLNAKAGLAQAEMALRERELTGRHPEPEELQALRDAADLKKREVSQSAGCYIRDHEAVQRISVRRQLHAFMQENGTALAVALAPELMHLGKLPERVRACALDRAAASIREALSVHLASGVEVHYAEDDRDILTAIGFRPDRASRTDNQARH